MNLNWIFLLTGPSPSMARPGFVPALMDIYSFILKLNFHLAQNPNKGPPDIFCSKLLKFSSIKVKIYHQVPKTMKCQVKVKVGILRTIWQVWNKWNMSITHCKNSEQVNQMKFVNFNSTVCYIMSLRCDIFHIDKVFLVQTSYIPLW